MPSISPNNQTNKTADASNPAGPQVVLNTDTEPMTAQNETRAVDQQPAKPTITQEEPTTTASVAAPLSSGPTIIPNQPATPEVTAPTPIVETVTQNQAKDNQAALEKLNQAEADLVKDLETAQQEEAGMINKMKKMIEQTGIIESKESKLSNKLKELKDLRIKIESDPTKAEELMTEAGLVNKTEEIKSKAIEETTKITSVEEKPKVDPNAPPPKPIGPSARKDESISQPPLISNEQKVLTALQSTFSNTDPTIAATLTADAKILRSQDKESLLVKSVENTIQFSKDDLAKAGITGLDLADIPFAENEPGPVTTEPNPAQAETTTTTQPTETNPLPIEEQNPEPVEGQTPPALTKPTTEMQAVLQKIQVAPNLSSKHDFLTQATAVYRSTDNNGIVVVKGTEQLHIADADLIQAGLTGNDIAGLTPATPQT